MRTTAFVLLAFGLTSCAHATLESAIRCRGWPTQEAHISFGTEGCFGGSNNQLSIERTDEGLMLTGSFDEPVRNGESHQAAVSKRVTADDLEALIAAIQPIHTTLKRKTTCFGEEHVTRISVQCGLERQTVTVNFSSCHPDDAKLNDGLARFLAERASSGSSASEVRKESPRER